VKNDGSRNGGALVMKGKLLKFGLIVMIYMSLVIAGCSNETSYIENKIGDHSIYKSNEAMVWSLDLKSPAYRIIDNNNELICLTKDASIYYISKTSGEIDKVIKVDRDMKDVYSFFLYKENLILLNKGGRILVIDQNSGETIHDKIYLGTRFIKLVEDKILLSKLGVDFRMLTADDFSEIWSYSDIATTGTVYTSIDDDYIYMNNRKGELIKLGILDGQVISKIDSSVRAPFIFGDNYVYARTYSDQIVKYDLKNEDVLWGQRLEIGRVFNCIDSLIIEDDKNDQIIELNKIDGSKHILVNNYTDHIDDLKSIDDYIIQRNDSGSIQLRNKENYGVIWELYTARSEEVVGRIFTFDSDFIIAEGDGKIHRFSTEKVKQMKQSD